MDTILVFILLIGLILCGMWVQFAVASAGLAYIVFIKGFSGLKALGIVSWGAANSFTLAAIPLFILMAEVLLAAGLSGRLYSGVAPFVRRLPGGLLHTNIVGSGIFAAISGGSSPTAAAMSTVAIPELSSRGYDKRLVCGSLAAGGTLGILIPPSITMIIYSTFTETSVAQLFSAGVIPGILLAGLYILFIAARVKLNPTLVPSDPKNCVDEDLWRATLDVFPFGLLIVVVLGSIYGGLATPTEAGAVGVLGSIMIAAGYGRLSVALFDQALSKTLVMTGNILFVVFASMIFAYGTALSGAGEELVNYLQEINISRWLFLVVVMVLFGVLGCFMEGLGMIAIIIPVLFPALLALGIDPIWFGIFVVILIELGQLTPPLGVILFVVAGSSSDVTVEDVIAGTVPFFSMILLFLILMIVFPEIALFLPSLTFGA
jgi:C4-dicarboxylate transporter DctM subunit